jgi:hypothetical protein
MERKEREAILGEWGVGERLTRRADAARLDADLQDSPLRGRPLPRRITLRPGADTYVTSLGGPLPYMARLRTIADETAAHLRALERAWRELAAAERDPLAFERRWRDRAARWSFHAVNELIDRHNRWYPAEARLPMDVRSGDFALVNGKPYRRRPLDAAWALERFPPVLALAREAA